MAKSITTFNFFFFARETFILVLLLQVSQPYVILWRAVGFLYLDYYRPGLGTLTYSRPHAENQVGTKVY